MTTHHINFIGWILFVVSAIGFCVASLGGFGALFGSMFFLLACWMFMIPFVRTDK